MTAKEEWAQTARQPGRRVGQAARQKSGPGSQAINEASGEMMGTHIVVVVVGVI